MEEIELKLKFVNEADAPRFKQLALLQSLKHQTQQLETVYYDTADLRLKQQRYALRVRKVSNQFIQTVKHSPFEEEQALQKRQEWETRIASNSPDLSAIPNLAIQQHLTALIADQPLIAVFTTRFHRDYWLYTPNNIEEIEIALDCGEILCHNNTLPILELELELKKGQKDDTLYQLAKQFSTEIALEPFHQSKAARGYKLFLKGC